MEYLPSVVTLGEKEKTLLSWGQNRDKHCCSSGVTECVSLVARVDSRTQRTQRGHMAHPGLGYRCPSLVADDACIPKHPKSGDYNRV